MKVRSYLGLAGIAALMMFSVPSCSSDADDSQISFASSGGTAASNAAGSGGSAGAGGSSGAGAEPGAAGSSGATNTSGGAGSGGTASAVAGAAGAVASAAGSGGAPAAAGASGVAGSNGAAGAGGPAGPLSFAEDVLPVLQTECGDCHAFFIPFASNDAEQAYAVATDQTSGASGDVPRYELIVSRVQDGSMPPECGGGAPGSSPDCVSEQDLQLLRDWAESGAPPPP